MFHHVLFCGSTKTIWPIGIFTMDHGSPSWSPSPRIARSLHRNVCLGKHSSREWSGIRWPGLGCSNWKRRDVRMSWWFDCCCNECMKMILIIGDDYFWGLLMCNELMIIVICYHMYIIWSLYLPIILTTITTITTIFTIISPATEHRHDHGHRVWISGMQPVDGECDGHVLQSFAPGPGADFKFSQAGYVDPVIHPAGASQRHLAGEGYSRYSH